jgi:hypothetical protein
MEQPKNTTDAKLAGAGTDAMVPEGTCHQAEYERRHSCQNTCKNSCEHNSRY